MSGTDTCVKYLVQNPCSLKVPQGTATLCLGNSRLTTAGRLQHCELSAPGAGEKPSSICFCSTAVSTDGPISGMKSQQGKEQDFIAECSPPGQMLKVAVSGTWKRWKEHRGAGSLCQQRGVSSKKPWPCVFTQVAKMGTWCASGSASTQRP